MRLYELTEQFLALQELAYDPEVDDGFFSSFGGETDHRESEMK